MDNQSHQAIVCLVRPNQMLRLWLPGELLLLLHSMQGDRAEKAGAKDDRRWQDEAVSTGEMGLLMIECQCGVQCKGCGCGGHCFCECDDCVKCCCRCLKSARCDGCG